MAPNAINFARNTLALDKVSRQWLRTIALAIAEI
jgi:hypothetical protein